MYNRELSVVKEVVKLASKKILDVYYSDDFCVDYKSDNTPVTIADKLSNDVIIKKLKEKFSNYAILSEESEDILDRFNSEYVWVIDPLDGTKEFIKKNDEFSINIALLRNSEVVFALIYAPVFEEMYYAIKGEGAFFEYNNKIQRMAVTRKKHCLEAVIGRNELGIKNQNILDNDKVQYIRKVGSARKVGFIARGLSHIHYSFGITMEWDVAAMDLIITEAGGIFRQLDGTIMKYNRKNNKNEKGFFMVNCEENILINNGKYDKI